MAKVIKAIIRKNGEEFHIDLGRDYETLEAAHLFLIEVAKGQDFIINGNEILDLGTSEEYEAIKVWYEELQQEIEVAPPEPKREYFERGYIVMAEYLGQKLRIAGLEARYLDREYFLPMAINGKPAQEALGGDKLKALLMAVLPAHVAAVVPPAQLPDYEEAETYIKDLGDEQQQELERHQEVKNKNAKAWQGWNEEGEA